MSLTMFMSAWFLVSVSLLSSIWHAYTFLMGVHNRRKLAHEHGCEPPPCLPQKDKLLGTDVLLDEYRNFRNNSYLDMLARRFDTCGHTWSARTMGRTNFATIDVENIKTILTTNSKEYGLGQTRTTVLGTTLYHGIFTSEGNEWRFLRRMSRPGFAASHIHLEPHVQALMSQIPDDGSVCHLQSLFHSLTLHNAAALFWGQGAIDQLDCRQGSLARRMNDAIRDAFVHIQNVMVLGPLTRFFQSSSNKESIDLVYNFILDNCKAAFAQNCACAKEAEEKVEKDKDRTSTEEDDDDEIRGVSNLLFDKVPPDDFPAVHIQLRQMFMAAETLTHLFHLLSRHPRSLRTLHAEVAQRLPNSSLPTSGDLTPANMPYLSGCVKETLRLFPTVPFNNRIALHDTILPRGGGPDGSTPMVVPAGSELSLPHYPLYRRHDIFGADADEFIPERWIQDPFGEGVRKLLSQEDYERQCEGYLPFSIGKRACPGRGIALETVRNTAVRVLQEFSDIQDAARGWTEEGEFWGDVAE